MTEKEWFSFAPVRAMPQQEVPKRALPRDIPWVSLVVVLVMAVGCLCARWIMPKDPTYLDLSHCTVAPCRAFWFGTDSLGRDIFSGIWYGGRVSLTIGFLATVISTGVAMVYGTVSGVAPEWVDRGMMRLLEILLSVPELLLVLFFQAMLGQATVWSLSLVIGLTGWGSMAKVIRTEVRQLRVSGYVAASRCMGGGFFHLLRQHLAPNFLPPVMFMVVMNVQSAIAAESTLSFLGMGLPLEIISWGSMLSLAQQGLMAGAWWMILIPGGFLLGMMLCLTNLGNALRKQGSRKESNL